MLRPGGALALVWNIRDLADTLQQRINELLAPARRDTPSEHEQPWRGGARGVAGVRRRGGAVVPVGAGAHDRGAARPDRVDQLRRAPRPRRARGAAGAGARRGGGAAAAVRVPLPHRRLRVPARSSVVGVPRDAAGVPADRHHSEIRAATPSSSCRSSQPSTTSSAMRSPWNSTGDLRARLGSGACRPRARARARRSRRRGSRPSRSRRRRRARRRPRAARRPRRRRGRGRGRPPRARRRSSLELRHAGRGTTRAPATGLRVPRAISTSVCFAVAISTSATPSSSQRYAA